MTFGQWLGKWAGEWFGDSAESNPNEMSGFATISISCDGLLTNGKKKQGSGGYGFLAEKPRKRDDDEVLMLLLQ